MNFGTMCWRVWSFRGARILAVQPLSLVRTLVFVGMNSLFWTYLAVSQNQVDLAAPIFLAPFYAFCALGTRLYGFWGWLLLAFRIPGYRARFTQALADKGLELRGYREALAQALFAGVVSLWPLGLARILEMDESWAYMVMLYGVACIWLAIPRRPLSRLPAIDAAIDNGISPETLRAMKATAGDKHFVEAGPVLGMLDGRQIIDWYRDADGHRFVFVRAIRHHPVVPLPGQIVVEGLLYQQE